METLRKTMAEVETRRLADVVNSRLTEMQIDILYKALVNLKLFALTNRLSKVKVE